MSALESRQKAMFLKCVTVRLYDCSLGGGRAPATGAYRRLQDFIENREQSIQHFFPLHPRSSPVSYSDIVSISVHTPQTMLSGKERKNIPPHAEQKPRHLLPLTRVLFNTQTERERVGPSFDYVFILFPFRIAK